MFPTKAFWEDVSQMAAVDADQSQDFNWVKFFYDIEFLHNQSFAVWIQSLVCLYNSTSFSFVKLWSERWIPAS